MLKKKLKRRRTTTIKLFGMVASVMLGIGKAETISISFSFWLLANRPVLFCFQTTLVNALIQKKSLNPSDLMESQVRRLMTLNDSADLKMLRKYISDQFHKILRTCKKWTECFDKLLSQSSTSKDVVKYFLFSSKVRTCS